MYAGISNVRNPPLKTSQLSKNIFLHQWVPKGGDEEKTCFKKGWFFINSQLIDGGFGYI
jgi:hypothetical protein